MNLNMSGIHLLGPSKERRRAQLESLLNDDNVDTAIIKILLTIEDSPPTIFEYRKREQLLENLSKALFLLDSPKLEQTWSVAFQHLVGSLYINFERFWGPTIRVITELLQKAEFRCHLLSLLSKHLKNTSDIIYNVAQVTCSPDDRPDHILHRNFILQLLGKFPYFVEQNSDEFVIEFLRFVDKEIRVSPFIEKLTFSNLVKANLEHEESNGDIEMVIDNEDRFENANSKPTNFKRSKSKRLTRPTETILEKRKSRETFITFAKILQSFQKIDNVRCYMELKDLFYDLLCCRDTSIQRAALNCIIIYNNEEIIRPHMEKVLRILNDKKVRSELTSLSLEKEASSMSDKQRNCLIPILMRILFGKMIGKIGRKSTGRDRADSRKNLVMRFIANCTTDEILYFFGLLFDPLYKFVECPYNSLENELIQYLDINNYVPINKLQAMLSSIVAFMNSIAHLKADASVQVYKMINIISFYVTALFERPELLEKIDSKNVEALKSLRRECINTTVEFFKTFEYYNYDQEELDFLFKFLIWPASRGFIDRNHATVTPILKFVEALASFKVYHKLLVKRNKLDGNEYLLNHVVNLYSDSKTKKEVLKFISSLIASILRPQDEANSEGNSQESPEIIYIEDEDAIVPHYDKSSFFIKDDITFGQEILLCHIPNIFERLEKNLQQFVDKKDSESRIEKDELYVLSTLSEFLRDPEHSSLGTKLLISTLTHHKKADMILSTLKTCQTLMRHVDTSVELSIIMQVSDLLSYQRDYEQRNEICNLVDVFSTIDSNLVPIATILHLMNSRCQEFLDRPDLVKLNEGFHKSLKYIERLSEIDMNHPEQVEKSLLLLVNQTIYIVNNNDRYEFSVRENCFIFYEKLAQKLKLVHIPQNESMLERILSQTLLDKFIRKGLRDTNEAIKHMHIGILRILAINCKDSNKRLNEISKFCDQNQDLDFWNNIRHIQLHNRSRALARLLTDDRINEVSPKTLSSFFLPIMAGFLFSKSYKSVSGLTENSIKMIGIICRRLNWITYESVLSYYLGLLTKANATYQRTNIKLITEILRNFHFDITACDDAMKFEEENEKLERRMKKRRRIVDGSDCEGISAQVPKGKRLDPSTARMVYNSVTNKLLPRLNSCLHEMTRAEFEHDKNMVDYLPEKDEIKRIPVAYAIIQLLNLLPGRYVLFRDHLPALFLKLCSFLKSKNEQVRKAARSTLIKVMNFVGPVYVPDLLRILKQSLDKGFQIHVLNFTVHSVMNKLHLSYGDLDQSVQVLVDSCLEEIFGRPAEDKDIKQILAKTSEAKKTKSFDTLLILASCISAEKLDLLLKPLKAQLKTANEPRVLNKLSNCISKVFTGLAQNEHFPLDKMLNFIESTIEESIPNLKFKQTVMASVVEKSRPFIRENRFLIEKDLPRDRVKSKINERGNYHLIVENSLRLLLLILDKNKITIKRKENLKNQLNGFVKILTSCLKSPSPRCVTRSLKCIHFIFQTKADLPSAKIKSNSIVKRIFIILNMYNGVGMAQGDNMDMIGMCFKTLTLLLLRCEHVTLNDEQTRALLSYIEQDICDSSRQSTAFAALQSMLKKKCSSPELTVIMSKVADLLVTSEETGARDYAVKLWQTYLIHYEFSPSAMQAHLMKFLRQLDYEFSDGRKAVLKMITAIVREFPERLLIHYFELIFNLLSQRVVNDDSKEIRNIVGRLIVLLIQRLPDQQNYLMNKFVILWASSKNHSIQVLGIKLLSIFTESTSNLFKNDKNLMKKITVILSRSLKTTENSKQEKNNGEHKDESNNDSSTTNEQQVINAARLLTIEDRLHYHSLKLFQRLLSKNFLTCIDSNYITHLKMIWQSISTAMMKHWHLPCILVSCELYLKFIKETRLGLCLDVENPASDNYLEWNSKRIVRTLCDNFIELLDRADESKEILSYITEALICLGQSVASCKATLNFEREYSKSFGTLDIINYIVDLKDVPDNGFVDEHLPKESGESKKALNLMWLSIKIVMQARKEAALFRLTKYHRRNFVLQWTAAIAQCLGSKRLPAYVFLFLMTPARELTDKFKGKPNDTSLKQETVLMSEDLLKYLKGLLGLETFNKVYQKVQLYYTRKRVARKKAESQLKIKDQVRGVKRKLKLRSKKKSKRKFIHL